MIRSFWSSIFSRLSSALLVLSFLGAGMTILMAPATAAPRKAMAMNRSPNKAQLIKKLSDWREEVDLFEDKNEAETNLKLDWIYRLRFHVERRYDGSEASLLRILRFMHELESPNETKSKKSAQKAGDEKPSLTKNLLEAIEKERERHEPLWLFVKTFVDDSSVSKPKSLDKFSEERDYINNFESVRAKSLTPDEIQSLLAKLGGEPEEATPPVPDRNPEIPQP